MTERARQRLINAIRAVQKEVREAEREIAKIDGARHLDQAAAEELQGLARDSLLVFQCHHGVRSQQAAEYFRRAGFRNLHNLQGGIEAWSLLVDPDVPRY